MLAAIIAMFTLAVALYGASATLLGQAPGGARHGADNDQPGDAGAGGDADGGSRYHEDGVRCPVRIVSRSGRQGLDGR